MLSFLPLTIATGTVSTFVLADPDGNVRAATDGGGLAHVKRGLVTTYNAAGGLPTDQLTSLAIAHPMSPVSSVVTISLGVASCIPSASSSAQDLLGQADAALYRAKKTGRNQVC